MGDNTHPFLSGPDIDKLIREGKTETEIGQMYGVSQQAVHKRRFWVADKRRTDAYLTPRERATGYMPWNPAPSNSVTYIALRAHSMWQVRHDEKDLGTYKDRLTRFYRKLISDGLIVEYDPTIPPGTREPFVFRKRTKSDAMLIIRQNEHTRLDTPFQKAHWSFPTVMPKGAEDLLSRLKEGPVA